MEKKVEELQALVKTQGEQIKDLKTIYDELVKLQSERIKDLELKNANTQKQCEELREAAKNRYIRMRLAFAFMLSAIRDGYKFPDEEGERLFYEFCDDSGVTEQDRKELFTDNK